MSALALATMLTSAVGGGVTRWKMSSSSQSARPLADLLSEVRLDPKVGRIENILLHPTEGVSIALPDCERAADAFPLWVTSIAAPLELDKSYRQTEFQSADVYGDEVDRRFSRLGLLSRYVLAEVAAMRAALFFGSADLSNPMPIKSYVRFYFDRQCRIGDWKLLSLARSVIGARPFTTR